MKILRMEIDNSCRPVYVVKGTRLGIEWMDDMEVIQLLADTGMKARTAVVCRDDLPEDMKALFDALWDDEKADLESIFETLFTECGEDFF